MTDKKLTPVQQIAEMTGLKKWKVQSVLARNKTASSMNLHRVTDDEMAVILHAAAEIGYVNKGHSGLAGTKVKEVTIAMVAKRAGVSIVTARCAMDMSAINISKETREHVLRLVKELGYKPTRKLQMKNFFRRKEN